MPDCYKVKIVLFRILIVILEASVVPATRHRGKICGGKRFQAGGLKSGTRLQYLGAVFCNIRSCADC